MRLRDKEKLAESYPAIREWISGMPEEYARYCTLIICPRKKPIFLSGDYLRSVYLICRGIAMISSSNTHGDEMNVVYVTEATTLGEMETVLQAERMLYTATAFTDCTLLEIPCVIFEKWIAQDINASRMLNRMFAEKLYHSSSTTVQYNHSRADMRLKMMILNHGAGQISETREELATACGVNVRTIYRILQELKEQGLVSSTGKHLQVSKEQIERLRVCVLEDQV